jgi:glycosyl hydrolase family 123
VAGCGALVLLVATGEARVEGPQPMARVVGPMVQVFPTAQVAGEARARLEAARGEWEPFQLVVSASGGPLRGVAVEASQLRGPDGAPIPAPRLARVEYVDVKVPSSVEGRRGLWPDPLVPDVDGYVGEKRRAFPFDVPDGEVRAVWVSLYVPEAAPPGRYAGQLTVTAAGKEPQVVPVELLVHRFTLPKTSTLPTAFGFSARAVAKAHPGLPADAVAKLIERYQVAALRHRLSLIGGSSEPAPWRGSGANLVVDFAPYDAEVAAFLDGKADPDGPAAGARWTALDLRIPARLAGPDRDEYLRQMVAHIAKRGWLPVTFDYTFDEPPDDKLDEVRQRAEALRRVTKDVPRLVTHALDRRLDGAIEIWCPVINLVDDKPGASRLPPRSAYHGRIWWYQSCMSHGCNIVGGDYFTGWPSYVVDASAMSHRIMEWLTYRYRIGGELYFNTVEAYAHGLDPWHEQRLNGGNGDGTLFYPGRPDAIGGQTDVPVDSIRLELIREGLEDYEYLQLYARVAGKAEAEAMAASIAGKTYRWEHDPARLMEARHRIAAALDRALAP